MMKTWFGFLIGIFIGMLIGVIISHFATESARSDVYPSEKFEFTRMALPEEPAVFFNCYIYQDEKFISLNEIMQLAKERYIYLDIQNKELNIN